MARKVFQVKAWIGVCDGSMPWASLDSPYRIHKRGVCDLFRTRAAAKELYEDVRRVTVTIARGLEGPQKAR